MEISISKQLRKFVLEHGLSDECQLPDVTVNPALIKAMMINEVVPCDPADDFYGSNVPPAYLTTTLPLFSKAGFEAASVHDIIEAGVYITNAVKMPKEDATIPRESIEKGIPLLEYEISLFPNLKVIMLMGDVAKKAYNIMVKKKTGKNVIMA